ncbi:MAG: hypothetical protein ACFFKA_10000 [Candidatus Thorarchaeota archaeon]
MPIGLFLYEIDESFGPNILAEYYLDQEHKVKPEILRDFADKHIQKEFSYTSFRKNDIRYYSTFLQSETIKKDNLYLGFVFKEGEDLVSLKSIFENLGVKIVKGFKKDKKELELLLKDEFNGIFSLMEKLKEPTIIKETINEKTKVMLDNGKLQEARELIDLGEQIPEKLSEEIKLANDFLKESLYKKAKRSFMKAAELAELIQEDDIVSFLKTKAEQVGILPDIIKEQETLIKAVQERIEELHKNQLHLYHEILRPIDKLINISNSFEEFTSIDIPKELHSNVERANEIAKELFNLDKKIKDDFEQIKKVFLS